MHQQTDKALILLATLTRRLEEMGLLEQVRPALQQIHDVLKGKANG
jgi:hypothetical protein